MFFSSKDCFLYYACHWLFGKRLKCETVVDKNRFLPKNKWLMTMLPVNSCNKRNFENPENARFSTEKSLPNHHWRVPHESNFCTSKMLFTYEVILIFKEEKGVSIKDHRFKLFTIYRMIKNWDIIPLTFQKHKMWSINFAHDSSMMHLVLFCVGA